MIQLAASVLSRVSDLLAPPERVLERRPDPVALPVRSSDWRGPWRDDRRH